MKRMEIRILLILLVLAFPLLPISCSPSAEQYKAGYNAGYSEGYKVGFQEGQRTKATIPTPIPTPHQKQINFNTNYERQNEKLASIERAYVTNNSPIPILNVVVQSKWFNKQGIQVANLETPVAFRLQPGERQSALIFPPPVVTQGDIADHYLSWQWER